MYDKLGLSTEMRMLRFSLRVTMYDKLGLSTEMRMIRFH